MVHRDWNVQTGNCVTLVPCWRLKCSEKKLYRSGSQTELAVLKRNSPSGSQKLECSGRKLYLSGSLIEMIQKGNSVTPVHKYWIAQKETVSLVHRDWSV